MTTANERVIHETKHGVRLYPPTEAKNYYRLRYIDENGQKREPSAGRDLATATAKAKKIDEHLATLKADPSGRTMNDLIDMWLADPKHRWSEGHIALQTTLARRFMRPTIGDITARLFTRADVERCMDAPKAPSKQVQLRAAMGSLLMWAYRQAEPLLPATKQHYMPAQAPKTAETSREEAAEHGTTAQYIEPIFIPGKSDAKSVAEQLRYQAGRGSKGSAGIVTLADLEAGEEAWLMAALATSSGLRPGELYGLLVRQLRWAGRLSEIYVDGQIPSARKVGYDENGRPIRKLPKWGRKRTTILPMTTLWGDDLHGPLKRHIKGKGPDDLVFTSPRGRVISDSNFSSRLWLPATRKTPGWHEKWTLHSLRHTFCTLLLLGDEELGRAPNAITDISEPFSS